MTTTQPTTPTTPARDAPENYTAKRMKALGLWSLAALVIAGGWSLWRVTDASVVMVPVVIAAVAMVTAGGFLWEYSSRAIGRDLPRQGKTTVNAAPPPIYVTSRMDIGGRTVDRDPQPVDFGVAPSELDAALRYLKGGGKTSRAEMCKALGISQGQWARLMAGLEITGAVRNNGRAGIDVLGGLDAMLADLEAQLGRW